MGSIRPVLAALFTTLIASACTPTPVAVEPVVRSTPSPATFVNGGPCPQLVEKNLPALSGCASRAGDLTVYAIVDDDRTPVTWRLRLATPTGVVDQPLHAGNGFSYPRAIGAIDVQGDGVAEWLVKTFDLTGHGAAWQQLGLFVLRGGRLRQVTSEGEALALRVGGISRMGEGAACRNGRLILLRVEADNRINTRWSYSERAFEVDGTRAHFVGRHAGRLTLADYNDPKLDPFYALECHGFSYP